tara:strand:- start:13522 stop:15393 length:1872 start_codon:yes stop_codon:yes gene_type:complete
MTLSSGRIRIFEPQALINQISPNSWQYKYIGLANTVKWVTKGHVASHAFFLVKRKDIEDHLPDFVNGNKTNSVSIGLKSDSDFNKSLRFYPQHAYSLTGVSDPDAGVDRTSFDNQIYLLHLTSGNVFFNHYLGDGSTNPNNDAHDSVNYSTSPYGIKYNTSGFGAYTEGWDGLFAESGNLSNADFPSDEALQNLNFQFKYKKNWRKSLLNEISHTYVHSTTGVRYIYPMGHVDTTTSTERNDNKSRLISVSNDINSKAVSQYIKVSFPRTSRDWTQYFTSATSPYYHGVDVSTSNPFYTVQVDITNFTASEIGMSSALTASDVLPGGSFAGIIGRLLAKGQGSTPSNSSDLTTYAKKVALLFLKSILHNNLLFNETYSGFVDFTATTSLSSIVWRIDSNGPTTQIRNVGARNEEDEIEIPNIISTGISDMTTVNHQVDSDLDVTLPKQFDMHRHVLVKLVNSLGGGGSTTARILSGSVGSGSVTWTDHPTSGDGYITVYNYHPSRSVSSGTVGFAYWNHQVEQWVLCTNHAMGDVQTRLGQATFSAIPANTSAVNVTSSPNSGTVYLANVMGGTISLDNPALGVKAYNLTQQTVVVGALVVMVQDSLSGDYLIVHVPDSASFG